MRPDILTSVGRYFNFIELDRNEFGIEEIAHALSNLCRYTGHVYEFYSVAQHSVYVSHLVPPQHALAGLLHDAAEAFVGDVAAPLKALLPEYKALEKRVEAVVLARFGLPAVLPPEVKHADMRMLATERRDLMPATPEGWTTIDGITPLAFQVTPVRPELARVLFLKRFEELTSSVSRTTPKQVFHDFNGGHHD